MKKFDEGILKDEIVKVMGQPVSPENITDETKLIDDLSFDSVMIVKLSISLEELYRISFSDENFFVAAFENYGAVKKYVISLLEDA